MQNDQRFDYYIARATVRSRIPDNRDLDYQIGKVVDNETGLSYPICYSHRTFEIYKRRMGCCPNADPPYIFIDDNNFLMGESKPLLLKALVFHEMYHILYDKIPKEFVGTAEELNELRNFGDFEEGVMPNEIEADKFGASVVGKKWMILALKELIKRRKVRRDQGMEVAIKEFEKRIEILERAEID